MARFRRNRTDHNTLAAAAHEAAWWAHDALREAAAQAADLRDQHDDLSCHHATLAAAAHGDHTAHRGAADELARALGREGEAE